MRRERAEVLSSSTVHLSSERNIFMNIDIRILTSEIDWNRVFQPLYNINSIKIRRSRTYSAVVVFSFIFPREIIKILLIQDWEFFISS